MNYKKLDKGMQKAGVEYTIEDKDFTVKIRTDPSKNDVAQKSIEKALGKNEVCINNIPGKFIIIQTYVRVYKIPADLLE